MKLISTKKNYQLTPAAVDTVSEDVGQFLGRLKASKKITVETRFTVEEILLKLMEKYGSEKEFCYIESDFLGRPYFSISFEGEQFNPLERDDNDEFGNWSSALIQSADYTPVYSFNKGVNTVTVQLYKKGMNPVLKLTLAILAAFLVSLIRFAVPAESISYITENILTPFYNAFLGLMATVEIPLVFLSVICGIIGIGDNSVFGKIGRKMILRFVVIILIFTNFAGIVFSMLFTNFSARSEGRISIKVGIDLLLDLVPDNLIEPITSGNTMQIVLMAIVLGIAIIVLGNKAQTISNILNEGNRLIVYITSIISKLLICFQKRL